MFGAGTYIDLKIKYEGRETKGRVTSMGRWGAFMKASAYSSLVVVDVAIVERDCAIYDAETTSALLKQGQAWHIREKQAPQRGDGVGHGCVFGGVLVAS